MKKSAIGVLCAGALAIAGALGTSYYVGERIQQEFERTASAWNADDTLSVRVLDYQRGITSSHAISLWSFVGEEESYDIAVTHDIVHGPWPWGKAARITSHFQLPPNSEPQLQQALKGQDPLQWRITADWHGATEHQLQSPAFAVEFEDASALTWGGLQAQWQLSVQRDQAQGFVHMPSMRTEVEEGNQMAWKDAKLTFDAQIPKGRRFWQGPVQLQIAQLTLQEPETGTQLGVQELKLDGDTRMQGDLVDMQLHSSMRKLEMPDYSAQNFKLSAQLQHIHADWLDQWVQWVQRGNSEEEPAIALWQAFPTLLSGKPMLNVQQLSVDTEDGPANFSAQLSYVGQDAQAFDPASDIQALLRAKLPKSMLVQLLDAKVRSDYLMLLEQLGQDLDEQDMQAAVEDGVSKRLKGLLELGAIQEDGEHYGAELQLQQGELTLNGKPTELQSLMQLGGAI